MRRFLEGLRATVRHLGAGPADGEQRVIGALAERTKELLAGESFEVSTDGRLVTVTGLGQFHGKSHVLMPVFIWRTPLPATERLTLMFESASRRLQEFLTAAYGQPWPAADTKAHVAVSDELISVWWGGDTEAEAVARLRPISRSALGV